MSSKELDDRFARIRIYIPEKGGSMPHHVVTPHPRLGAYSTHRHIPVRETLSFAESPHALTMLVIEQGTGTLSVKGQLPRLFSAGDMILLPKNVSFELVAGAEVVFMLCLLHERAG